MTSISDSHRLAIAILQFLREELANEENTPDKNESLEVAIQCLKLAYKLPDESESDGVDLLKLFVKEVPASKEPETLSVEEKRDAEKKKQEGNELMKGEKFEDAVASYTKAIQIDPRNAVYYCNRAAAFTGMDDHDSALKDCKKAIAIDKNYSKAYSRMGLTYSKLEAYEMAVDCYENALKLDPNNDGYKNNMEIAKEKIKEKQCSQPSMPGFGGLGGLGGMSDMMNNPMFMNMAQQVLRDPDMQQMAMNMMSNFMGTQQASGEASETDQAASGPNMANMLQMGQQFAAQISQENPELIAQLKKDVGKTDKKDDSG